jgi:hypothetical protein
MTTIACDRTTMVADSKVSIPGAQPYPADKIIRVGNRLLGACGHNGDCTRWLQWAAKDFKGKEPKWVESKPEDAVLGIVLDKDGIYVWNFGDPEPERINLDQYAVGSGGLAARVAMILGKTPIESVELACTVDDNSDLPLQVLHLDPKKD